MTTKTTDPRIKKYNGDLTTLDIFTLIERLPGDFDDFTDTHMAFDCPWNSSHKLHGTVTTGDGFPSVACGHPACDGYGLLDFLDLFPADEIDSLCAKESEYAAKRAKPNTIGEHIIEKYDIVSTPDDTIFSYKNKKYWLPITKSQLRGWALSCDKTGGSSKHKRDEITSYISAKSIQERIQWRSLKPSEIPLNNGVFDVKEQTLRPHNKNDYLETVCPVNYDPKAESPTWLKSIATWFGDSDGLAQKMMALEEFLGYCLMPHALFKKCLFCYGPPDTGKSQIALILKELVGFENCCSIPVDKMADSSELAPIKGKMVNIVSELPKSALLSDGGFKQLISTGDPIQINEKYLKREIYTPFAKHIFVTNNLPRITDHTNAVYNRLLFVQFNQVIPKAEQDKDILNKLKNELPGILNAALSGARRLIENNGEFTIIKESIDALDEYKREENPIYTFIEDFCTVDKEQWSSISSLHRKYKEEVSNKASPRYISELFRNAGYDVAPKWAEGNSRKCVLGIKLNAIPNPLS